MHRLALLILVVRIISINCSDSGSFYYFAYGSNLLARRLHINNPSAVFYSIAQLEGYRLDFNMTVATWNGAVATICEDPGSTVWGALWTLDEKDKANLDKQEGVHHNWYLAKIVTVTTPLRQRVLARTYQEPFNPPEVLPARLPPERRPSITYQKVIVLGATEVGLPQPYIAYLQSFKNNGLLASTTVREQLGFPFLDNVYWGNTK